MISKGCLVLVRILGGSLGYTATVSGRQNILGGLREEGNQNAFWGTDFGVVSSRRGEATRIFGVRHSHMGVRQKRWCLLAGFTGKPTANHLALLMGLVFLNLPTLFEDGLNGNHNQHHSVLRSPTILAPT